MSSLFGVLLVIFTVMYGLAIIVKIAQKIFQKKIEYDLEHDPEFRKKTMDELASMMQDEMQKEAANDKNLQKQMASVVQKKMQDVVSDIAMDFIDSLAKAKYEHQTGSVMSLAVLKENTVDEFVNLAYPLFKERMKVITPNLYISCDLLKQNISSVTNLIQSIQNKYDKKIDGKDIKKAYMDSLNQAYKIMVERYKTILPKDVTKRRATN